MNQEKQANNSFGVNENWREGWTGKTGFCPDVRFLDRWNQG